MRKAEVLRLKPGDRIVWGHSKWTVENVRAGSHCSGVVLRVTPRGGVLVRQLDEKSPADWHGDRETGPEYWIPYPHHLPQKRTSMRLDPDNKSGMWICNALMIRKDVTDEEKKIITGIQREILANPMRFEPSENQYFWLRRIWTRGKRNGGPKRIKVRAAETRLLNSYERFTSSLVLTCEDCGHKVEVFGISIASQKRGAIMLREQCAPTMKTTSMMLRRD